MTSHERMQALIQAIDYLEKHKIEGDIVECGVWKGGSMLIAAKRLLNNNSKERNLYLFDTFEGMSNPTDLDISSIDNEKASDLLGKVEKTSGDNIWCYSTEQEVAKTMTSSGYPVSKIHLIKGKVEDTIPHKSLNRIALLRLDTDWYESTKHELENLFDLLVPGGILIIDDYGHWSGARKAVDEFIEKRKLKLFLNRIDYTGRIAIKN
ncbi:MAG: class I SAM-dependent methyltransferase [Flavipsychrobacter sp.]|nr:class I SAM-dependent methyltransferase [Flavipsychrobacter sp.]